MKGPRETTNTDTTTTPRLKNRKGENDHHEGLPSEKSSKHHHSYLKSREQLAANERYITDPLTEKLSFLMSSELVFPLGIVFKKCDEAHELF